MIQANDLSQEDKIRMIVLSELERRQCGVRVAVIHKQCNNEATMWKVLMEMQSHHIIKIEEDWITKL